MVFLSWKIPLLMETMQKYYAFKGMMELGSDDHNTCVYVLEQHKAVWGREQCLIVGISCAF